MDEDATWALVAPATDRRATVRAALLGETNVGAVILGAEHRLTFASGCVAPLTPLRALSRGSERSPAVAGEGRWCVCGSSMAIL